MKQLEKVERISVIAHILSMLFGLLGLLIVLPHPEIVINLPPGGQTFFQWSMAGGGVIYILLGALAVSVYTYRTLGLKALLTFLLPSVVLSLSSELLGTSTGFPFGHYHYLEGLGYKIAGLVPFTIPLSWFYVGMVCYLMARAGLGNRGWVSQVGAIFLGALLLTAWDFVLDPAMSQTNFPFWQFEEAGAFFGMPYRNILGWFGTGVLFMSVAAFLGRSVKIDLDRSQFMIPLTIYLVNIAFGAIITLTALDSRFWFPAALAMGLGVIPAFILLKLTPPSSPGNSIISVLESTLEGGLPDSPVLVKK